MVGLWRACLFKSADEIFAHVRALPPGVYDVYKELPRDPSGIRNSEYWGEVTKHEIGEVSYSPVRGITIIRAETYAKVQPVGGRGFTTSMTGLFFCRMTRTLFL